MPQKVKKPSADNSFNGYVVGIGASAGGLEAINAFFDNVMHQTGCSFVVIQHLSPDYKSLMSELLTRHTKMKVMEATDDMPLLPDHIYLIPSKKYLTIESGKFHLREKLRSRQPSSTIDVFLESLAREKGEKAVGIVLSGTGSDGSKGITAIKNHGGIVIVQDPLTAEFDGMPNSALATGTADLVLPPEIMPDEMLNFIREAPLIRSFNQLNNQEEGIIDDILIQLYKITQQDFSHYKRPTLNRRIAKRMAEKGYKNLSGYYKYLQSNNEEAKSLCSEFLINVTKFFRDEEAFEVIRAEVIPSLFLNKTEGDTIKVWVVAASTGEEAYSLAILFEEYIEREKLFDVTVKIFATDIDKHAINMASRGYYSVDALKPVSHERLKKYFVKEKDGYRVSASLRKSVVFASHDIVKDPPFSKIDLLTCRNMLIYMNAQLQKSILQKFHFALNDDGYLFLGNSENTGILKDVLKDVNKKWKIYKCISKAKIGDHDTFINPVNRAGTYLPSPKAKNALNHLAEIFRDTLLDEYQYAGIFIDRDFEVKQATGAFKNFISFPEQQFNFNLLKLVPPDLSVILSTSIRKAIKENEKVVNRNVKVQFGKTKRILNVVVKPYLNQKIYLQPFLFVILSENEVRDLPEPGKIDWNRKDLVNQKIEVLEQELSSTKENLQAVIEEVESANEELQSSNEEIISANEELQSTNEELQSLNEELHTVNAEHQLKIKELIDLNDDLNNYFANSEVGQILIDRNLVLRKFTPFAKKQINLIETDIGRSITDLSINFRDDQFIKRINSVIRRNERIENEIVMNDGKIFQMRIAPFLREDKSVDGVVVNFIDISHLRTLNSMLEAVLNSSNSGIIALNSVRDKTDRIIDFEISIVNQAAERMLKTGRQELVGRKIKKLYPEIPPEYFQKFTSVVKENIQEEFEYHSESNRHWYDVVCLKMMDGLVITFSDVTERKEAAQLLEIGYSELKLTTTKLEKSNLDLLQFASVASHDLKEPLRKIQTFGNILRDRVRDVFDDTELKYLDKMISSSNRMQNLVDDILMLSRLSNTEVGFVRTDLNDILSKIIEDLEIFIKEKNATIKVPPLPELNVVPGQMHQLFQNLISNGLKFNENKKPTIRISASKPEKALAGEFGINPEDFIKLEISDNGIGFEQIYAQKIFGIFQRLDGNSYQGSGIGLAICKKIVENHKGYIKAISEPGKGASFVILLPVAV